MSDKVDKNKNYAGRLSYSYRRNLRERFIESVLFLSAALSVVIMLSIVVMLVKESFVFFSTCFIVGFFNRHTVDTTV